MQLPAQFETKKMLILYKSTLNEVQELQVIMKSIVNQPHKPHSDQRNETAPVYVINVSQIKSLHCNLKEISRLISHAKDNHFQLLQLDLQNIIRVN